MDEFADKFLTHVATAKGITKPKAAKFIDDCIKKVSAILNIPNAEVQADLYSSAFLKTCLLGSCDRLDLEQCAKSCHCAVYEDRCISRSIPDAELINKDPDKYAKGMRTSDLEALVKLAAFLYYNYEGGGLTDNSFDSLEWNLNKIMKLRGRRYEKIGADPVERIRAELPLPMPSLSKVKPGTRELREFLVNVPPQRGGAGGLLWSHKLDGVSGMVVYRDGKIQKVYTRGNGTIGGDVTHVKDYINFPELEGEVKSMTVRGEFVMSRRNWVDKYKLLYSNARSFVSGQLNQGFVSYYLIDISFVAYDIMAIEGIDELPEPSRRFRILAAEGFKVVQFGELARGVLTFDIISLYREHRASAEYDIDGLVLTVNVPGNVQRELRNPFKSVAFKMIMEDQVRDTVVTDVEWNISRHGKYTPVAIFEAVFVGGIRLHRASAFNGAHIRDWNMGVGTQVKVVRSGDVIPQIKDVVVDASIDPIFPSYDQEWHWKGAFIVLDDVENNKDVQIKRLYHFFSTIGTARLGPATAEKLWGIGLTQVSDVTQASIAKLSEMKGFAMKSATTLSNNIHKAMQNTPLDRFMDASTTLQIGIGRKLIKDLLRVFPDLLLVKMSEAEIMAMLKAKKVKGFGPARIANTAKSIPKFRQFLMTLNPNDIERAITNQKTRMDRLRESGYNEQIAGNTFVLTGFMSRTDYELEDYIYDNQGNFSSVVTKDTTAVIAASIDNITDKMINANSLGVKTYSVSEFVERFSVVYTPFIEAE
jgi:DNA ligase (NAD+)